MKQKETRSIPKTGVKTFENRKKENFFRSLLDGAALYSPLFGYLQVKNTDDSGIVMTIPYQNEDESEDFRFLYDGRAECFDKGECMLFLSHLYRSWNVLNFHQGDIVTMNIKYKDGNTFTHVLIFREVTSTAYPQLRTYFRLCKNSDILTYYSLIDLSGANAEEESIELRYATPAEEKLLNNAIERNGKRWVKEKLCYELLGSEDTSLELIREDFNALQKEYNRLTEHCKKLENERNDFQKKAELESGRIQELLYKVIEQIGQSKLQIDD